MDLDSSNQDFSLFEAVLNEDFKEAAFLLSIGANPNRIMSEQGGVSSFHIAVGLQNDLKFTRLFLNNHANVNLKSEKEGWTPLHVCAFWNKYESLQLLLLNKADVTIKDKKGKTAEQVALENKSLKCLKILRDFSSLNSETYSSHYYENKWVELPSTADYCSIDLTESVLNDPTVKKSLASSTFTLPSKQTSVKRSSEHQRTPKKKEKPAKPEINSDNLEKLIDDLIDRKLNALKLTPTSSSIISPSISSSKPPPDVVPTTSNTSTLNPKSAVQNESANNQSHKRFHSPEKLPHFYTQSPTRSIIDDTLVSNSLSKSVTNSPTPSPCLVTKETQTNAKLIRVKQILRRSREASSERLESLKPNVAKLKGWLSKVVNSPGASNSLSNEKAVDGDGYVSPQTSRYQTASPPVCLSASANKRTARRDKKSNDAEQSPINLKQRSSSLISSNTTPTTSARASTQPHVDELYSSVFKTDRFPSKSTLTSKYEYEMSKKAVVHQKVQCQDGPINIVENKKIHFDSPNRYNFKTMSQQPIQSDFDSSLLTNDESTIIINENDMLNSTKKSSIYTYRTAPDNINDYMEMIENDYEELSKQQQAVDLEIELSRALENQDDEEDENMEEKEVSKKDHKTIINQSVINKKAQLKQNGFSNELIEELISKLNMTQASDVIEANMFNSFKQNCEWREGNVKSAFNYLLIDPRVTQNLPLRAKKLNENEIFNIFISGIFYIGKGSRARPYAHLYDSLKYWKNNTKSDQQSSSTHEQEISNIKSKKIKKIIEIWKTNHGIVSLHCFQSVIPSEAYTREAAMIDAVGLGHLTNMKKGNYYGIAKEWPEKRKRELGTVLLRRACAIFLAEGEREIYPTDI